MDGVHITLGIVAAEHRRTHNGHVQPVLTQQRRIGHGHAAVGLQQSGVAHFPQGGELPQHVSIELLPAKARLDSHYQHHVRMGQQVADSLRSGAGLDGQTRLHAPAADMLQHGCHITGNFSMDGQHGRACIDERIQIFLRVVHHQVDVQGKRGKALVQRLGQRRAEAQIRHKMGVHDIHMKPIGAGVNHALNVAGHVERISR